MLSVNCSKLTLASVTFPDTEHTQSSFQKTTCRDTQHRRYFNQSHGVASECLFQHHGERSDFIPPASPPRTQCGLRWPSDAAARYFEAGARTLVLTPGSLKLGLGGLAGLRSAVFRIVFAPELMKSMSSLSPRFSFTRPSPNDACSIQSCGFQIISIDEAFNLQHDIC